MWAILLNAEIERCLTMAELHSHSNPPEPLGFRILQKIRVSSSGEMPSRGWRTNSQSGISSKQRGSERVPLFDISFI